MQKQNKTLYGITILLLLLLGGVIAWEYQYGIIDSRQPFITSRYANDFSQKNLKKKIQSQLKEYLTFLYENYNGYPGMGENLQEINTGTRAIKQFCQPFALQELKDVTSVLVTTPYIFSGDVSSGRRSITMLELLSVMRSLRGHMDANYIVYIQPIIDYYPWLWTRCDFRYSYEPLYEWVLFLSESGEVPKAEAMFHGNFHGGKFSKDQISSFVKALLQNAMVAEDIWSQQAMKTVEYILGECDYFEAPFVFQPDSYLAASPDQLKEPPILTEWIQSGKDLRTFPAIQVWRDPRRFYPTKQYELELKTLTPERMQEIGEEADAELCQKIAAGPLPRADRFPMFLFDPEIRPAVFLAYDKAFLADPPVPGYGESMERYLALREKLHWLNSHSRYAKYQAPLQEEFDKLAPKFADKEKAIAELEAAYLAKNPERPPAWTPPEWRKKK